MSRELVIKCDKCGDVIEDRPYSINFVHANNRDDWRTSHALRTDFNEIDLCESCIEDLLDHVADFMQPEVDKCEL